MNPDSELLALIKLCAQISMCQNTFSRIKNIAFCIESIIIRQGHTYYCQWFHVFGVHIVYIEGIVWESGLLELIIPLKCLFSFSKMDGRKKESQKLRKQ